jgi:hypothetical protein
VRLIFVCRLLMIAGACVACGAIPKPIRIYSAALPGRADGQYAVLDDSIKKQLVLMDAALQCEIDQADKKKEEDSAACKCTKSSSADWTADCKGWLGAHTPVASGAGTGSN